MFDCFNLNVVDLGMFDCFNLNVVDLVVLLMIMTYLIVLNVYCLLQCGKLANHPCSILPPLKCVYPTGTLLC